MSGEARNVYLQSEAASVKGPYIVIGLIILAVAVLFLLTKLPDNKRRKNRKEKFYCIP
jgi:FHS family L-fucose permease-like MFS transporter